MGDIERKARASLKTAWLRLTSGPESLPPAQQRRMHILLSITVSMFFLAAISLVAVPFLLAGTTNPQDRFALGVVTPVSVAVFLCFTIAAFLLGRTGRYVAASLLIVVIALADSYVSMVATGNVFFLATMTLSVLLAGILVSWQVTLAVLLLSGALMATLPFIVEGATMVGAAAYFILDLTLGALSLVSALIRDGDLRQIEEQTRKILADQEELLGARKMETVARLSAGVAHELNNIMTAVMGYAEVIQTTSTGSASGYAGVIREVGKRATSLTEHLLSFSRQQMLQVSAVSINGLVTARAKAMDFPVVLDLAPESSPATLDARLVGQALETLLRRSALRAGPGGKVTVSAFDETVAENAISPGGYRVVTVSDDGPPLDEELMPRVFDPFFTTGDFGSGEMDLAAAYGIIAQSGGSLSSRRDAAGRNSWVVYLPLAPSAVVRP